MAFQQIRDGFQLPIKPAAGTGLNPKVPVRLVGSNALLIDVCSTQSQRPFGVLGATALPTVAAAAVYEEGNYVKVVAAASVGVGAEVAVASPNGAIGPVTVASGSWAIGLSVTEGRESETITILIKPRRVAA